MATRPKKQPAGLGGPAYRVNVELSYPTDPDIIARLGLGERIPAGQRALKVAPAGSIQRDIPATSIPWLLDQGLISPAEPQPESEAAE